MEMLICWPCWACLGSGYKKTALMLVIWQTLVDLPAISGDPCIATVLKALAAPLRHWAGLSFHCNNTTYCATNTLKLHICLLSMPEHKSGSLKVHIRLWEIFLFLATSNNIKQFSSICFRPQSPEETAIHVMFLLK